MSNLKAVVTLSSLKHALKVVGDVVPTKVTIPILSGVRMQQVEKGLAVEATDLDTYLRIHLPELGGPAEPMITPAKKFIDWAKLLTGEDVKISATDRRATLQCGRSKVVLPLMAASSWPAAVLVDVDDKEAVTLTQGTLARALRFAIISMSEEESRYTMCAILLDGDGTRLRAVATDGHRLTVYSMPCAEKFRMLLPARFIKVLRPLLADEDGGLDLAHNETAIRASIAGNTPIQLGSRTISGNFPNYAAVMPKSEERQTVTVDAAVFTKAVERTRLLADEDAMRMTLEFSASEQIITMAAASSQNGESQEVIDCEGVVAETFKVAINPTYLLDLSRHLDGKMHFKLGKDGNTAVMIEAEPHADESLAYIVMPMRA